MIMIMVIIIIINGPIMKHREEAKILNDCIQRRSLKQSDKRLVILDAFIESDRHCTAEELHAAVREKDPSIGIATIYRALQLFVECGIGGELRLGDAVIRYYPTRGGTHHDHLICLRCGKVVNIVSSEIEKLQQHLAAKNGFQLESHRLELFGVCENCLKKKRKKE